MKILIQSALLLTLATGCAEAIAPAPVHSAPISATHVERAPGAATAGSLGASSAIPEAVSAFEAEHVTGAMAIYDSKIGALACSDRARCERGYIPASTFKIANTIIGLESGVLSDADSPLPWDGKEYQNPDWNRDHTLRSAVQVSCEPCFQSIARKVGSAQMKDWVNRLEYGNRDASGAVDQFWLRGNLRISPYQQLDFLRRLDGGKLPIQEHTLDTVRDVITLDVGPEYILRGKTGSAAPPDEPEEVGWFVGFVELGERRVFFATVLDGHAPNVDMKPLRRALTERVLRERGELPG